MADLRVEMSSEKDSKGKKKPVNDETRGGSSAAVVTLLAGVVILAAALYYPNSLIVGELRTLIEKIENQTNPTGMAFSGFFLSGIDRSYTYLSLDYPKVNTFLR